MSLAEMFKQALEANGKHLKGARWAISPNNKGRLTDEGAIARCETRLAELRLIGEALRTALNEFIFPENAESDCSEAGDSRRTDIVFYATREEAERKTGYFSVSSIGITEKLAIKIADYIEKQKYITHYKSSIRARQIKCKNNYDWYVDITYTKEFSLREYWCNDSDDGKNFKKTKKIFELELQFSRSLNANTPPTLTDLYFMIVQNDPTQIVSLAYYQNP